ncbi:tRNA (N6-isopentenyl adenosine(37)-C2)-methylthiotransferase MiaB [Flavobacteriaceae bacterium]|nr:tRNA (N6-isopentenyl adenosine(37)-C2)-methylthiotransferase MiaB [Flavobacteriaceae bacterium]MDB4024156.1 tRNA (N6-isopentenyl adenosine(37)-C2)-methylthiotransferase MiaB [Flavobacteriaceae bacterium]MDB4130736.1 tRNA (N6-isopentenyl adenosine(37)-C2)-methylthiotransferase MiaB [Flavobacteriaceae bacterium]MDB9827443.1 tRNA (N6-isopentenyl adenosine(37)-C2)-methylthiotransferase MiaB [Flavobacteriaceae bacterium]MDC1335659.1 tRNA (N6-isopentenyl adenosine(37)-C2)-methylthiotransferase Mia
MSTVYKIKEKKTLTERKEVAKKFYIESYGCQMNFADSEVVASIVSKEGYNSTNDLNEADLILLNTCSIREKAELTVRKRLESFNKLKIKNKNLKVGVLGCMAERLKSKFLDEEKIVDLVVGPDAYKDIPNLLEEINEGRNAVNVILSKEETYGDISPVRLSSNGVTAFVSITRGCDNMCTFCVVPFTRGRERSRDPKSILNEIHDLNKANYKEITLLGQNVDSYLWYGGGLKKDFKNADEFVKKTSVNFSKLLKLVAESFPNLRIRFSTSNPQDMSLDVIKTMSLYNNICNYIHLPVQSGSDPILKSMNRQHTRDEYLSLIKNIKKLIPNCGISHDMITGFPNESDKDHEQTLSLMEKVKYDFGYMFKYSERPGTYAAKKFEDNVEESIKKIRLQQIIDLQRKHSHYRTKQYIGKVVEVLIEKESKKSTLHWAGRNEQNTMVVFPKESHKIGDFVKVKVLECTSATLIGISKGL